MVSQVEILHFKYPCDDTSSKAWMSLSPSISSNTLSLSNINNISTDKNGDASLSYTFNYESLSLLSSSFEKQNLIMRVHHQKKLNKCTISEGYVADEIITSAAGARIRVGNTDAEGRMAMADCVHHMKLKVILWI